MILRRAKVKRYNLHLPRWRGRRELRVAVLSDLHGCWPWMTPAAIARIVAQVNALSADLAVFLGDLPGHVFPALPLSPQALTEPLSDLTAPLGVYAVLGNHDWAGTGAVFRPGTDPVELVRTLEQSGVTVLRNEARRLQIDDMPFWLAGLDSQRAFVHGKGRFSGAEDLEKTLGTVDEEEFLLLLAHEPDIFPKLQGRVDLTLSGHTHAGQIRLFGRAFYVPSEYGREYDYGLFECDGRNLIVSGGLGCTGIPLRIGIRPEINLIEVAA